MTRRLRGRRTAPAHDQAADQAPGPEAEAEEHPPPPPTPAGPEEEPAAEVVAEAAAPKRRPRSRATTRAARDAPEDERGDGGDLVQRLEEEISQPSGLLRACLLLLLGEQPGHGYDLHERLKAFGFDRIDASRSYRALHWLEKAELAEAHWETDNRGPARRVYELTPAGRVALERCVATLQDRSRMLTQFVARYRRSPSKAPNRRP